MGTEEQKITGESLDSLILEFEDDIYPILTRTFGLEWTPGIDKDTRITILIHPMKKESGGYINLANEYPKVQAPESNEREMIYLSSQYINTPDIKVFLAHEFVHLVTFNQKDKINNVSEDVWLNEARADFSSTLLGYDKKYEGSNLQGRVKDFLDRSSDSLTEWRETAGDYGVVNLFTQYLVDHYGVSILADSIKLRKTGIESLNAILVRQGFKEDFVQIFNNWAIAVLLNNCQVSEKYCYYNQNLKDFRLVPLVNYLPFVGDSVLSVNNTTKDWSGNWHRFIGGRGRLEIEFKVNGNSQFKVPYIIEDSQGNLSVNNLILDTNGTGRITLENFGIQYASLTIIPIAQNKISGFNGIQPSYSFFWSAATKTNQAQVIREEPKADMGKEKAIAELKNQITAIQLKIIELLKQLIQLLLTELAPSANM